MLGSGGKPLVRGPAGSTREAAGATGCLGKSISGRGNSTAKALRQEGVGVYLSDSQEAGVAGTERRVTLVGDGTGGRADSRGLCCLV